MLVMALVQAALAAEVVWLDPAPSPELVRQVSDYAAAEGPPLRGIDLRAAGTARTPEDDASWAALAQAVREVRPYEQSLDGELIILRDLERPIAGIGLMPDANARDALYVALAYQGFAAWRLYGDGLATEDEAAPWRLELLDGAVPKPWADAVAIAPARRPTPYELAEAGARAAYDGMAPDVAGQLPAALSVGELPAGASLVVDGAAVDLGVLRQHKVVPGRHLAHVLLDGEVIARFDLRLGPAGEAPVGVDVSDAVWDGWGAALRRDAAVPTPEALRPRLAAIGEEVIVAWTEDGAVRLARVTAEEARREVLRAPRATSEDPAGVRVGVALAVGGGWLSSGDFYTQDPLTVPNTVGAVNAGTVGGLVELHVSKGLFRASVGLDQVVTLGKDHVALTGDGALRYRPAPYVGVGVRWAQVVGGYLFPYHPAVGAHATIPITKGVEVVGSFLAGIPGTLQRPDGDPYDTLPVYSAWAGVGWRYGGGRGR